MQHEYIFLNWISLDAGSWAEWFSGTMSALAVVVALVAYPLARRQRRAEERAREVASGRSIGWKALKLLNATADIDRHIEAGLSRRSQDDMGTMKYQWVQPLGVPERPVQELNQAETDLLLKAGAADLLAEIDMSVERYASIVFAMNEYRNRHVALYELMPPPIANAGMQFTHRLSPEEMARVRPYAAMLEALLEQIIALVDENMEKANAALAQYGEASARYFGKRLLEFDVNPTVAATHDQ